MQIGGEGIEILNVNIVLGKKKKFKESSNKNIIFCLFILACGTQVVQPKPTPMNHVIGIIISH